MENLMANLWWILIWVVLGLIAGATGKVIMPGEDGKGFLPTALLGMAGSVIGGFLASFLNIAKGTTGFLMTLVFAIVGSLILLVAYRLATGRSVTG